MDQAFLNDKIGDELLTYTANANRGDGLPAPYSRISEKHAKLIP